MTSHYFSKYLPILFAFIISSPSLAGTPPISVIDEAESVDEATDIIINRLQDQGFDIPLVLDHAANAARVGLELRPTKIIFARPPAWLERKLLKRSEVLALDLPFKFLVFENEAGELQLRYNPIGYLIDRHDLKIKDSKLSKADRLIEQFGQLDNGIITVASLFDRDITVQNVQDIIGAIPAFGIPLVLDYEKNANCSLIVFGNPNVGTPLMQTTQEIALDLPQKFLVCASKNHTANIYYNDPFFLAKRHNLQGQNTRLEAISNALRNFANTAAGH